MKDYHGEIQYKGKTYALVFNLNVMQEIQEEYGSLDAWATLTDGSNGEPNAKAVIFGFCSMLNEGLSIYNDEHGEHEPMLTLKQTGRIITEVGLAEATNALNDTVIESTKSIEKNA